MRGPWKLALPVVCAVGIYSLVVEIALAAAPVTAAALSPDEKLAIVGSQAGIEVRSWPQLTLVKSLPTDLVNIHDLRFSPDGQTLLAAGGSPAESGAVEVFRWPEGQKIRQVPVGDDVVYCVALPRETTRFATAGADGICQIIDAATGKPLVRYAQHSRAVLSIAFLPDGDSLVSAGVDQTLRIWNGASGQHIRTLDNHVATVNAVSVRPATGEKSPPIVASIGEDRTVRLWQPTIGRLIRFARLSSIPRSMVWSPDGNSLFVGCNDGRIHRLSFESLQIESTRATDAGRIHECVVNRAATHILLGTETGCRAIAVSDFGQP